MKAQLIVVQGKPRNQTRTLEPGECLIGRGEECQVRMNSPLVSRQHCLLRVTADEVVLHDLGSTNGTLVNGKRVIGDRPLQAGDMIQIGVLVLELRIGDESSAMNDTKLLAGPDTHKINPDEATRPEPAEATDEMPPLRTDANNPKP